MKSSSKNVTQLLLDWAEGDQEALNRLMPLVYAELHRLANRYFRHERPGHTLQATALVHEAYLRIVDQRDVRWQNRLHFFAIAAQLMRRILVNYARDKHAAKRGGAEQKLSLDEALALPAARNVDLIALDEALTRLAGIEPQQSSIVELRFFGGLTIDETAGVLGVSPATVKNKWNLAKAWLYREVRQQK
jgi:RNA polymerase sigma factor (TIGR02999 family)